MALVRVNFTNSFQLSKVIIARGLGVIQKWNNPPKGYVGPEIRNLNLPVYRQKNGYEINNFQSNYKRFVKPGAVIKAGKKQLKYLGLISSNDNKEVKYEISNQV